MFSKWSDEELRISSFHVLLTSDVTAKPLVLFVVTEDWYFVSHRLALAERIKAPRVQVAVATASQVIAPK